VKSGTKKKAIEALDDFLQHLSDIPELRDPLFTSTSRLREAIEAIPDRGHAQNCLCHVWQPLPPYSTDVDPRCGGEK